jgi:hypothetical protein
LLYGKGSDSKENKEENGAAYLRMPAFHGFSLLGIAPRAMCISGRSTAGMFRWADQ